MFSEFNLLYVEDEEVISKAIVAALSEFFNEIFLKENGEEGLEFYKNNSNKIDLVITDINMPIMDGLEMAEKIKLLNPNIPIIITTAYGDNKFLRKAIEIGIDSYVMKPLDIRELLPSIKKVLSPKVLEKKLEIQEKENQERLLKSAKYMAIGQLAAGLTHEINTPLTYIKGSVEIIDILMDDLEDEKMKKLLKDEFSRIDSGVNRLINIVESMKEVVGNSSEEFLSINIFETVVIACIMAYNRSKHISNIKINGEQFTMKMDKNKYTYKAKVQKQRIEQVWIIMINNALDELIKIKNFDDRELNIHIKDEKENIVIEFEDNGGGIDEQIMKNIFEPFKSTKDSSGLGIGLSIAKKIVDEQSGEISIFNDTKGARFKITLPK